MSALTRSKRKMTCQCCSSVEQRWCYRWFSFWYCAPCLNTIGLTAAHSEPTDAQFAASCAANYPRRIYQ